MQNVFISLLSRSRSILSHSTLLILCLLPAAVLAHDTDNKELSEQVHEIAKIKNEVKRNLADLQPKAVLLATKLLDMQADLKGLNNTKSIEDAFGEIKNTIQAIAEKYDALKSNPEKNSRHLTALQNELQLIERDIIDVSGNLDDSIASLDEWLAYWSAEEKDLDQWHAGLGSSSSLAVVQNILQKLQATVGKAKAEINDYLLPLLELQGKAVSLQVTVHKLHLGVDLLFKNRYQIGLYKHAPALFSAAFFQQFTSKLWHDAWSGMTLMFQPDFRYLASQSTVFISCLVLFLALLRIFSLSKSYLKSSTHWSFVFHRSFSVSVFISLFVFLLFADTLPPFWLAVFRAVSLLTVIRISREITRDKLLRRGLTELIILLLITDLLVMADVPMPLMRVYIITVSIALLFLLWVRQKYEHGVMSRSGWMGYGLRFAVLFLLVLLLAEVFGEAELAFFVFSSSLKSLFTGLFLGIFYLIIMGLVELGLHFTPIPILKENAGYITRMFRPIPFFGCLLAFISVSLVDWRLFTTSADGISFLSELGFTYGGISISFGLLCMALMVLYLAYCLSRVLQSILLQSVLPRQNVDQGIQLSITRLLHYSIMLSGFLIALGALGFSLTNLTILGGALGVGIGFGLQEIIKNFACGLILLFERPIKLGDTIEIAGEMAVVKELGLRATVVQTMDNAEIVLPNADLITGQVTNWTLQERRARVKVPVGVAYGTKVEQVIQILLACAEENPQVLSTPKAKALFLDFGESSLDFELRVFIPEFSNRRLVQSELNIAINSEFEEAGIEIPFPQSDLHLRSVDPAVVNDLQGS